jgi:hypothetical protein
MIEELDQRSENAEEQNEHCSELKVASQHCPEDTREERRVANGKRFAESVTNGIGRDFL